METLKATLDGLSKVSTPLELLSPTRARDFKQAPNRQGSLLASPCRPRNQLLTSSHLGARRVRAVVPVGPASKRCVALLLLQAPLPKKGVMYESLVFPATRPKATPLLRPVPLAWPR